jgi:hypothetical protein
MNFSLAQKLTPHSVFLEWTPFWSEEVVLWHHGRQITEVPLNIEHMVTALDLRCVEIGFSYMIFFGIWLESPFG